LLDQAKFNGVAPLIAHNLVTNGLASQVPQPYLERLSQTYNNTLYTLDYTVSAKEATKVLPIDTPAPLKGTRSR
jgi:hypothetical protein